MDNGQLTIDNFGRDGKDLFGKNVRSRLDKYGYSSLMEN